MFFFTATTGLDVNASTQSAKLWREECWPSWDRSTFAQLLKNTRFEGIFSEFHQSQSHIFPSLTGSLAIFLQESNSELILLLLNSVCFGVSVVTMGIDHSRQDNIKHRHWYQTQAISCYHAAPSLHSSPQKLLTELLTSLGVFRWQGKRIKSDDGVMQFHSSL